VGEEERPGVDWIFIGPGLTEQGFRLSLTELTHFGDLWPNSFHRLEDTVGLTPTGVQRSLARLISRPDRGRQPTDGCGPPSRYAQLKGGEGLGDEDD
jgi:hypothetical protein